MRLSLILRAVTTSWVAVIANASVGIFLTPYVLHRLGDEAFGVWILTTNLVGYYGILDAGVRSAIIRYVSRHKELNEPDRVNEVVASAFYYYLAACFLIVLATHLSVNPISHFFSIHRDVLGPRALGLRHRVDVGRGSQADVHLARRFATGHELLHVEHRGRVVHRVAR